LILFSLLLYALATGFDLVADDKILLENNPYVRSFHYLGAIFTRNFWSFLGARGESTYYRPLVMFWLLVEREVFGPRPWGFHFANVLLNALVVVLVFLLGRRLWPRGRGALWAGLLFAALPVHSENVAPISGLPDLLCAAFFVSALLIYTQPGDCQPGRLAPWLAAGTFLLAALCKEVALVLPLLAAFYEHSLQTHNQIPWWKHAFRYAPMFLALALYFTFRLTVVGGLGQVLTASRLGWAGSLLFGLSQIGNYSYKLVWPLHLSYAWKFRPPDTWWDPSVLLGGFVVGLATVAFARSWRRDRAVAFAIAWFFLTLAPALNLAGLGVTAYGERYLYIPSVAFCWLLGEAGAFPTRLEEGTTSPRAKIGQAFLALLVVLAATRTALRLPAWRSNLTLAQATLAEDPNSATHHLYLGNNYRQRGERGLARIEYVQAIALDPSLGEAYLNMAGVLLDDGAAGPAREFLERAVEANPRLAEGYFELGRQELHQQHPELARDFLERAVALNPNYFEALFLLGTLALEAGRLQEAQAFLTRALAANPLSVEAVLNLGAVRARKGDVAGAAMEFQRAMELAPGSDAPYLCLAALFEAAGKPAAALDVYRRALRALPASANAQFRLGVLALKMGRVEEARQALENAVAMQPTSALAHLQLGFADRAAGKLPEARREFQEALRLDPSEQAAKLALQQIDAAAPRASHP
jgi:tetratricopeptide (TPR) repeat protein